MPFATIALDRLIEAKASKSMTAGKNVSEGRQGSRFNGTEKQTELNNGSNRHWNQISPALYATPEPTPLPELPDSSSSFTVSPYIVNHKRRGPRLSKALSEDDVALRQGLADEKTDEMVKSLEAEDVESCRVVDTADSVRDTVNGEIGNDKISNGAAVGQENLDSEVDDFFDPQDSLSVRSSTDGESSFRLDRTSNLNSSVSEFYDAWEELSSESGSQPSLNYFETELRELRISLLSEIEKRKQAEELINKMNSQCRRICEQLSNAGLNLPEDLTMLENHSADDLGDELSRQVELIRLVSSSIGRGVAKAELEEVMEAQLETKNFEIARLLDRLRYYEAVNHEMSQRNQESIETMRCLRQRRKARQRWIWGSVIAAVTVGSAALAWSYLPSGNASSSTDPPSSHTSEGSHATQQ